MNQKKTSIVDPLVRVQVYGVPADVAEKATTSVANNGTFPSVHDIPALVVLNFDLSVEFKEHVSSSSSLSRPECNAVWSAKASIKHTAA